MIWLYTLRYHNIILDRFCWSLAFPRAVSTLTLSASSAASGPKVQKCETRMNFQISGYQTTLTSIQLITKFGHRVYQKKHRMLMI